MHKDQDTPAGTLSPLRERQSVVTLDADGRLRKHPFVIVTSPKTESEFAAYYDLRWRILRRPWNQPPGSERDDLEPESIHLMACDDGARRPLAVGRLHLNSPDEAQIRYMAVEPGWEGRGLGRLMLEELERHARTRGVVRIVLNARQRATGFYLKHGYVVQERGPLLFGDVPHLRMTKSLHPFQ